MKRICFFSLLILSYLANAQAKKVTIEKSDYSYVDEEKFPGATVFIGDVIMHHDGAKLTCKKALYYQERNFFKAFGDVVINQGDTIKQTSDYSDYDANTKQALSWGNVVLTDPSMVLKTDTLHFDRINQKLYYKHYATIKDETNVLKSKYGNYYLENKKFTATTRVTVDNPEHNVVSNHLDYYTQYGTAYLYGPSTITNSQNENKIYCERGFYNTKTDISHFVKNAKLFLKERTIEGDSLYYDKNKGFASATKNIKVIDTVQNSIAKGHYAELFDFKDSLFITKRAVAISVFEKDSSYTHGDTLLVTGKAKNRILRAFHNVKIFKSDLQGKCDSLHTNEAIGLTKMYRNPVLWSEKSQITGDTIHLLNNSVTNKLDSLKVLNNSLIVQKDSLGKDDYNQIKGRNMFGKFEKNKLRILLVKGNAESVYYNRDDSGTLETITKEISSNIEFTLVDNEIEQIKYITSPDGTSFPPDKVTDDVVKLKGFIWRDDERPKVMEDIFIKDLSGKPLPKVKKGTAKIKEKPTTKLDSINTKRKVFLMDKLKDQ
ncbi:OstA-like protein [Lutibacter sp. Hel_I_33_5]|uniref:OstA-like protein n=1 Tax=Lutibacter sp. Hel_I_33_5 TaxID=1566289 RepID=UPI0011A1C334|nr:OstA-like protein [Lutibacter sp. Hel_I_33_5]